MPPVTDHDYRVMVDAIADYAVLLLDPEGHVRSWNSGAQQLTGYTADEIIGRHFSLFYPPEQQARQQPQRALSRAREQGRFSDEDWRARKDGTPFWASVTITPLFGDAGELRGFCKVTRDLSERRQQEEALRQSEERFRLLVEGVKDYAIFMLDPTGHIVSWNEGARLNKGYEAHEIIGRHFSVFYPENVVASGWPDQELQKALADGRYEEEGWRLRKDGSRFWANVVITALRDSSGHHRGFAKVTRDLTEKRRVTALEDEGRRLTAFIAMLAHELRNPLAPISNAVSILGLETSLSPHAQLARDIIARQQKQMVRLVNDLLDISRITAGNIQVERKPVRMDGVVAEAAEAIAPLLQEKGHHLDRTGVTPGLWVCGDHARLVQILSNLLNNAAKFTAAGGNIRISVHADGDDILIAVRDDGAGIAPERLPHLFHRFMQREDDAHKTHGGLGLGLSLVQQLTTLHQGSVKAFSTGIAGEGSEFVVRLPAATAPVDAAPTPDCAGTLLVVDDSHDAADTLALLLRSMGYRVETAYTGQQAITVAKTLQPQAILMDIGLPDIDGVEVASRLTAELATTPAIIAVTGYGLDQDRERSFKAGFYAHLTKPVNPQQLDTLLRLVLG